MKWIVLCAACMACFVGCSIGRVNVKNSNGSAWDAWRVSVLQKLELPELNIDDVGNFKGYNNDGGVDATMKLIEKGIELGKSGAAKAVLP